MSEPVIRKFRLPNGEVIVSLREDVLRNAVDAANAEIKRAGIERRKAALDELVRIAQEGSFYE